MEIVKTDNLTEQNENSTIELSPNMFGFSSKHGHARLLRKAHRHWTHRAWLRKRNARKQAKKSRATNRSNGKRIRK